MPNKKKKKTVVVSHSKKMEENLTPYQGKRRSYGYFQCPDCDNSWESGYSWANMGQDCRLCDTLVYPYQQQPLKKVQQQDQGKHGEHRQHREDLCEKCDELGHSCTWHDDDY